MSHYRKGENKPTKTGRAARTRIGTHNSPARRRAILTAHVNRHNTGTVTAGQALTVLSGDPEFSAKYDSPYGKAVRAAYIELHGEEPKKIRLNLDAKHGLHRAVGYLADEAALTLGARNYVRTAHLAPAAEPVMIPVRDVIHTAATTSGLHPAYVTHRVDQVLAGMSPTNGADKTNSRVTPDAAAWIVQIVTTDIWVYEYAAFMDAQAKTTRRRAAKLIGA